MTKSDVEKAMFLARDIGELQGRLAEVTADRDHLREVVHWARSVVECHPDYREARLRDLRRALGLPEKG